MWVSVAGDRQWLATQTAMMTKCSDVYICGYVFSEHDFEKQHKTLGIAVVGLPVKTNAYINTSVVIFKHTDKNILYYIIMTIHISLKYSECPYLIIISFFFLLWEKQILKMSLNKGSRRSLSLLFFLYQ